MGDVVKMGPNTEKTGFKEGDRVGSGWHVSQVGPGALERALFDDTDLCP